MKALLISFQTTCFQEQTIITLIQTLPILEQIYQQTLQFQDVQELSHLNSIRISSDFYGTLCFLIKILTKQSLKLRNVPIIPLQKNYFQILQAQCNRMKIETPLLMLNTINIYEVFKLEFGIPINHLQDITKFLRIRNNQDDKLLILKQIWQKVNANSNVLKYQKFRNMLFSSSMSQPNYFRVSGFPFHVNRNQIKQCFSLQKIEFYFVYQKACFQGILVFKVQVQFLDYFQKKIQLLFSPNLQIQKIGKREYQQIITNQECRTNTSEKQKFIKNNQHLEKRERSRSKEYFQISQEMCAIRLRGLPFNIQKQDLYKIFRSYRAIKESIKLGHRNGRRSGEAMMAFKQKQFAIDALQEDGKIIMNRYLQIKLSSVQEYKKFK